MAVPVIVVDDDLTDRMIVRRRLERSAYAGHFASIRDYGSGEDFLADVAGEARWPRAGPPVVLIDVNMPRMDGFDTVDGLGAVMAGTGGAPARVFMMSASIANPADAARAGTRGMIRGILAKPLSPQDIERIAAAAQGAR